MDVAYSAPPALTPRSLRCLGGDIPWSLAGLWSWTHPPKRSLDGAPVSRRKAISQLRPKVPAGARSDDLARSFPVAAEDGSLRNRTRPMEVCCCRHSSHDWARVRT